MKLFAHQIAGIDFFLNSTPQRGCGAMFHEIGTGKTISGIHLLTELRKTDPNTKLLVICPISLIESAWQEDTAEFNKGFGTKYTFLNLRKLTKKSAPADIYAINYDAIRSEEKRSFIKALVKGQPWLCILDESSKIKNHGAMTTKELIALGDLFKYRVIATGTPAPNSEMEYWPQMQFIQRGMIHPSFYAFRNKYFYLKNRYTGAAMPQGMKLPYGMAQDILRRCDYTMSDDKRAELMGIIKQWAHFARKKDCLDLPETVDEVRKIYMSKPQRAAYQQMKQHLILELKDSTITAQVALTKVLKLRQITSGFVIDENGTAIDIPEGQAKLNELQDIIDQAGEQQIIIWIQFHWEMNQIVSMLERKQIKFSTLYSQTDDRDKSIADFKSGENRILVAHPKSGSFGLTFVKCHLQVFFSIDFSLLDLLQCRGRTDRPGQNESTTYIFLLAEDSIDEHIHKVLTKKGDAQELINEAFK